MRSCVVGQKKIILPGELALLFIILNNSMCVVLMLRSGSGISAISSVPYAFFAGISGFDSWNMDLYFSGISCPESDGYEKAVCSRLSL